MAPRTPPTSAETIDEACATLSARLRGRFPELEASLAALVDEISNTREVADYLDSLHGVRPAALEYVADVIELGERRAPGVPPAVRAGARMAARSGVSLDAVLRRYSADNTFIGDILVEEADMRKVAKS